MPSRLWPLAWLAVLPGAALVLPAQADDRPEHVVTVRDHRFLPAELVVPAGQKFVLVVDNQDSTPEEFESHELNREKVVTGHSRIKVYLGPLDPGTYPFFGDFHPDTAQGHLVVR